MKERPEKFRPEWDSNPHLCYAIAVPYQLSYQAKLVIMWFYDKPIDCGRTYLMYLIYEISSI